MSDLKTPVLAFMQRRLQSLIQPLHNEQAQLRSEILALASDYSSRAADLEKQLDSLTESVLFSRWIDSPGMLASRAEAGHWLNSIGLTGNGVEVGVFRGEFSNMLLRTWRCTALTSVDPWREFPSTEYVDTCNFPQAEHDRNLEHTTRLLSRFGNRSRIIRETSADAATRFANGSLDFVYLDAQHHYEAVRDDIAMWLPKVRAGGVIGGHDYLDGDLPSGRYGVKQAVNEMIAEQRFNLVVTREPDWPSWFAQVV